MLMMPSAGVMAMTLTGIACELNLHMVGEDHHHMIATVVTVVGVVVDFLGALTIAYWSLDYHLLLHGKT